MDSVTWVFLFAVQWSEWPIIEWPNFQELWQNIARKVRDARETVEPVAWVLGSVLALIPGSFAIYKWIYYRRSRLPYRLDELLRHEELQTQELRTALLSRINRLNPLKRFIHPLFLTPSMASAVRALSLARWWHNKALPAAEKRLEKALGEIDLQVKFCESQQAVYKRQQAAAYLLKGAIAVAHGEQAKKAGKDDSALNRVALSYFLNTLQIDQNDMEALEYAAHQHRVLNEFDEALGLYVRLVALAGAPGVENARVRTRALRYQGEIFERKYDADPEASKVRAKIDTARDRLRDAEAQVPAIDRGELERAYIHRALATVEDKRETATLWSSACDTAERIYEDLIRRNRNVQGAQTGLDDIRAIRDDITRRRLSANLINTGDLELPVATADGP